MQTLQGWDETRSLLHSFWQRLIDRGRATGRGHLVTKSASNDWWLYSEAGIPNIRFIYRIWPDGRTGLLLEIRRDDQEENKTTFDRIYADRDRIEERCGHGLQWERRDDTPASYVVWITGTDLNLLDHGRWPAIHDAMLGAMDTFVDTLEEYVE